MNILVDGLPEFVLIDGEEIPVESDFRGCLRTILAFEDEDLTAIEKTDIMLRNFFGDRIPQNAQKAIQLATKFLNGGEESGGDEGGFQSRLYSFSQDASLIYAAFRQTHGIDLETEHLHWWKFLALFMDLGQDTTFCTLVALRKRIQDGSATKEDRKLYREIYDMAHIKPTRTVEELKAERKFFELARRSKR